MSLRDMGDKDGGRTWWGVAIMAVYGVLQLVSIHFGAFLPPPWGPFLLGLVGVLGVVITALGLGRKVGRIARSV